MATLPENDDDVCETCSGEMYLDEDRARGHEHYTVRVPCPDCNVEDFDDRDPDELDFSDDYEGDALKDPWL